MQNELISILLPVGDIDIKILKKSLSSIENQTYNKIEIIFVCDTTNLNVRNEIKSFCKITKFQTKIIINKSNLGVTKSLNKAIKYSKGKFLARFDSDDIMFTKRIETQYKFLKKNKEIDIVFSNFKKFFFFKNININNHINNEINILKWRMIFNNQFCHPTVMFRRGLVNDQKLYNEKYSVSQDYDLWTRMINANIKFNVIEEYLYFLRIHKKSVSISKRRIQNFNSINIGYEYLCKNLAKNIKYSKKNYEYLIYILNNHSYDYIRYKLKIINKIHQIIELYFEILNSLNMSSINPNVYFYIKKDMNLFINFIGIKQSIKIGIFKYFNFNLFISNIIKNNLRKFFL